MSARTVVVGEGPRRALLGGDALGVLAGPCVVESEALVLEVAGRLVECCDRRGLPLVFKSSYKKANRSSARSYTGPGDREGLRALAAVKRAFGVPIVTDVHAVDEVGPAAEVADLLQVPAFLCRQTELLVACAQSGRPVTVKKGQFLAPEDMRQVVEKLESAGARGVLLTERGATFGYHNLVVDMRSLVLMGELGWPVVYDVTHSLQRPGGEVTGGDRRFALPLARAAVATGVDAVFFETHPDPARALSDASTQLPLAEVPRLLDELVAVRAALRGPQGAAPAQAPAAPAVPAPPTVAPATMPGNVPGGVSH